MKDKDKAGKRWKTVTGLFADMIDAEVMRAWIDDHGGGFPFEGAERDATAEQLSLALYVCFQREIDKPGVQPVECGACNGSTPDSLESCADACPFCGFQGEAEDVAAAGDLAPAPAAAHDEHPATAVPEAPEASGAGKKKKKAVKAEAPAADAAPAKETEIMAMQSEASGKTKANGIVKVKGKGPPLASAATVGTLDRMISEAEDLKKNAATCYVEWGKKVGEIYDRRLWQLRVDGSGKAQYASWDAFATKELGITPGHAERLMRTAREFTPEDYRLLGHSKMALVLQSPPEARKQIKEEAPRLTKRQLEARVKESRAKAGYTGETPQQKAASQSAKNKKPKAAPAAKVTAIANLDGKKTIKLYQRPPTMRNLNLKDLKRAVGLAGRPFGIIELANEGRLLVEVKKTEHGLVLSYEFQRAE